MRRVLAMVLATASLLIPTSESHAAPDELYAPEKEFSAAISQLDVLRERIRSTRNVTNQRSMEPEAIKAAGSLSRAEEFYDNDQFLSAIREVNSFFGHVQAPEPRNHLDALFILAHSQDSLGLTGQATRSYLKYIATFITSQPADRWEELLTILPSMMSASSGLAVASKGEVTTIVSSVAALSIPVDFRAPAIFAVSRTARDAGRPDLADQWLGKAELSEKSPELASKTLYLRGVILLAINNYDQAETALLQVLERKDPDPAVRDMARLSLARLEARRKNQPKAVRYYLAVPETSSSYRTARYEAVFALQAIGKDAEALAISKDFLSRFEDGPDTLEIATLLAHLQLKAGDRENSLATIDASDRALNGFAENLRRSLRGRLRLGHSELIGIQRSASMLVRPSPLLEEGIAQFSQLAELSRRLADERGAVRNLIYAQGRAEVSDLNPTWVDRSRQINEMTKELLLVGHRMILSERQYLERKLTPAQLFQIDSSARRRIHLTDARPSAMRRSRGWITFANLATAQGALVRVHTRLGRALAESRSAAYLAQRLNRSSSSSSAESGQSADLAQQVHEKIGRSLEKARQLSISASVERAPHNDVRSLFTAYANGLHQEEAILSSVRSKLKTGHEGLVALDADKAWSLWRATAKTMFGEILDLSTEVQREMVRRASLLNGAILRAEEIELSLDNTRRRLELAMGQAVSTLSQHYESEYVARRSRNKKSRGDLKWAKFEEEKRKSENENDEFELEQQKTNESFQDLRQGVTTP